MPEAQSGQEGQQISPEERMRKYEEGQALLRAAGDAAAESSDRRIAQMEEEAAKQKAQIDANPDAITKVPEGFGAGANVPKTEEAPPVIDRTPFAAPPAKEDDSEKPPVIDRMP